MSPRAVRPRSTGEPPTFRGRGRFVPFPRYASGRHERRTETSTIHRPFPPGSPTAPGLPDRGRCHASRAGGEPRTGFTTVDSVERARRIDGLNQVAHRGLGELVASTATVCGRGALRPLRRPPASGDRGSWDSPLPTSECGRTRAWEAANPEETVLRESCGWPSFPAIFRAYRTIARRSPLRPLVAVARRLSASVAR
jgi:hypothetical protein